MLSSSGSLPRTLLLTSISKFRTGSVLCLRRSSPIWCDAEVASILNVLIIFYRGSCYLLVARRRRRDEKSCSKFKLLVESLRISVLLYYPRYQSTTFSSSASSAEPFFCDPNFNLSKCSRLTCVSDSLSVCATVFVTEVRFTRRLQSDSLPERKPGTVHQLGKFWPCFERPFFKKERTLTVRLFLHNK